MESSTCVGDRCLTRPDPRRRLNGAVSLRSFHPVLFATAALLVTPSACIGRLDRSPAADVAGADETCLSAVNCSSANSCMAVG